MYREGRGGLGVQQEANIAVLIVNEASSILNRCSARAATRRTRDNKTRLRNRIGLSKL